MKNISKHFTHYLALVGILLMGVAGFAFFSYDRGFQIAVAVALAFGYFAWGIIHHLIHKDLYLVIAVEYFLISLMGLAIMVSLVVRT